MSNIYTFHRAGSFYPVVCKSDEEAIAAAENNPGTVKVVNELTHVEVWTAKQEPENKATPPGLTLTVAQIKCLAEFAGWRVTEDVSEQDQEHEITITPCPEKGIDNDGAIGRCQHIAYFEEYPEEGVFPLDPLVPITPSDA